jgi:hypothetical protein
VSGTEIRCVLKAIAPNDHSACCPAAILAAQKLIAEKADSRVF